MEEDKGNNRRDTYRERVRAKVRQLDARIEELAAWARDAEADLRAEILSDDSRLRRKLANAQGRIEELRAAAEDGWEEVKAGAQKTCVDVRAAWDRGRAAEPEPPSASGEPDPDGEPGTEGEATGPAR